MIVVLAGATGTGKTALSLDLADALAAAGRAAEIVNADALQLYRGLEVGTAKLPVGERRGVPHHLFDLWQVTEVASVAVYREAARSVIVEIERRGAVPILVGGSGLYLEALLRDFAFPGTDPELRARLEQEGVQHGTAALWQRLRDVDPVAAGRIPAGNLRRVVRALEVVTMTAAPYSASLPEEAPSWRPTVRVVVDVESEVLATRLTERARRMWHEEGLLDEVRGLLPQGLAAGRTASRAIGYAQAIAVLDGTMTPDEALAETIRLTWRVVRRQRSWFRRYDDAVRVDGRAADTVQRVLAAVG